MRETKTMYKFLLLATAGAMCCYGGNAVARTTFLPDWQMAGLNFQDNDVGNFTRDEVLCIEAVDQAGSKLYHKASSCTKPKKFDETCAHDDRYISECYCHEPFVYTCTSPYRGDTRKKDPEFGYSNCDNLWVACCDERCPSGTSKSNPGGCGGSTRNDCGDTCYYPYQPCCYPYPDETGCSCGSYSCSDGCGGTRTCCESCCTGCECDNSCPPPEPPSSSSSGGDGGSSNSGGNGGSSNSGSSNCASGGSASCTGKSSCASDEEENGSCKNCSGETLYSCKKKGTTCVDGGSSSCTGKSSCGSNEEVSSSCKTCTGQTLYSCKKIETPSVPTCVSGGSSSCTGQTSACSGNQVQTSSCKDCSGVTHYTCCTPQASVTSCGANYCASTCDDGCGGTRTCCTYSSVDASCASQCYSAQQACGGKSNCTGDYTNCMAACPRTC